jgi:hexosaminidase
MPKTLSAFLLALILSRPAVYAADLPLTPYPNHLEIGEGVLHIDAHVNIQVPGNDEEDRFAASLLMGDLNSLDGVVAGEGSDAARIVLARAESAEGRQILQKSLLKLPLQADEESYVLVVTTHDASIVSKTSAGIFYGVQTLRQLLHPLKIGGSAPGQEPSSPQSSAAPRPAVGAESPVVRIVDSPAIRWRGVSLDISRGPIPTFASLKRDIALLAEYKINVVSPYMENAFAYPSLPNMAAPGGAITPDEARELVKYAAQFHVTIIPEQESFGHLHLALQSERFQDLAEVPYGNVLSPNAPGSFTLIGKMFADLAEVFPSPFFHIGADETDELGEGRTKPDVGAQGYGKVYIDYLRKIDETLSPYHRKILFWGDMGVQHPDHLKDLPHDMIAVAWDYSDRKSFVKLIRPFSEAGLKTWVAPGVSNWNRIYPDYNVAMANIRQFVTDGKALGSTGVLNTTWMDDGEGMVNFTWYGLAYGAAHSWQKTVDDDQFNSSWDWTFYRADDHHFAGEVKSLTGIHDLLHQAINSDGMDSLTWRDAMSSEGQSLYIRMEPAAHQIRLTAEDVIADLLTNSSLARRNGDLLDYTEFAARRFDFLGQKAIYAKYVADLYGQAQQAQSTDPAAVHRALSRISDLLHDMGHQTTVLRDQYQKLWLGENRPYYLGNILARYDQELGRWETASDRLHHNRLIYDQRILPPLIDAPDPAAK